jgi:hypothetical protein
MRSNGTSITLQIAGQIGRDSTKPTRDNNNRRVTTTAANDARTRSALHLNMSADGAEGDDGSDYLTIFRKVARSKRTEKGSCLICAWKVSKNS